MGAPAVVNACPKCSASFDKETGARVYVPDRFQCWKCGKRSCAKCGGDTGCVLIAHCTACQREIPDPPGNDPYSPVPVPAPPKTARAPRRKARDE